MHILVCDDHPIFLSGIEYLLKTEHPDYVVDALVDGREVAGRLRWTRYDLLLLDLNLPHCDGLEVFAQIRAIDEQVPVLLMSAETNVARVRQGMQAGAAGFLPKSTEPGAVLMAIDVVRRGHVYLPEDIARLLRTTAGRALRNVTPRQVSVLELVAQGLSNKEIAVALNLTEYTVKSHMRSIFSALNCKNRTACVREAQQRGILHA